METIYSIPWTQIGTSSVPVSIAGIVGRYKDELESTCPQSFQVSEEDRYFKK